MKRSIMMLVAAGLFSLGASSLGVAMPVGKLIQPGISSGDVIQVKHGHGHGWGRRGGRGHHYGWSRGRHRGHR